MNSKCYFPCFLLFFLLTAFGPGRDIYVSLQGTNNYPYANWPDAATNIEWAVNAGTNSDTVWISNGTYYLTNQITVNSNISIVGTGGAVVVNGNGAYRCFYFPPSSTSVLASLFITGGYTNGNGGGVWMRYGTVSNCTFSNNLCSANGGGMYVTNGSVVLQSCVFIVNNAAYGGGLYIDNRCTALVDHCSFYTNTANYGGGIYDLNTRTSSIITGCDFTCNVATNNYGGVAVQGTITHCTITSNVANNGADSVGGGVGGTLTYPAVISNCFISNNIAYRAGGGIYGYAVNIVRNCRIARNKVLCINNVNYGGGGCYGNGGSLIQDCIIEENTSGYYAGGVFIAWGLTMRNCLIRNNVAVSGGGMRYFTGGAAITCCTIVSNRAEGGNGGGIFENTTGKGYIVSYSNCIIQFNFVTSGNSDSNLYINNATTSSFVNCCFTPELSGDSTNYSTNNIITDPQFVEWTNSNYHLAKGSPCINSGINGDWMTGAVDLDGYHRVDIFSGIVDMGCYEHTPSGNRFSFK